MTVSESSRGMKQSVKVKALMKLGGLANQSYKIARRINTGPHAPSAQVHYLSDVWALSRSTIIPRRMLSRETVKSLFHSRASMSIP